jgi:hypothetical protein
MALRVAAAILSAFGSNPFGSQCVDFDFMAGFALIAASVEFDSLLLRIAAGVDFRGHCLLAHPKKGK